MGVSMSRTTKEMNLVDIEKLIPYVNNARTHSTEQINKIRASLREFGFVNPVIIDKDYNIIAGHGRVAAAKAEGIKEVPCVLVDYLTPAQKKAYILADNRMALDAGWDEEMLKTELESLKEMDFDLSLTGFETEEVENYLIDEENVDEVKEDNYDVDQALQEPTFVKKGDLFILGKHRLICGDSTNQNDYDMLLGDEKVDLIMTDPPYNVNYGAINEDGYGKARANGNTIANDNMERKDFYEFLRNAFANAYDRIKNGGGVLCMVC